MNCQFCYTGRMGLLGNLSTAQIVEQVVEARRFLAQEGRCGLTHVYQRVGTEHAGLFRWSLRQYSTASV